MSSFTEPVFVEVLDNYSFKILKDFEFYIDELGLDKILIPAGFITDFASVPRIFWNVIPPIGKYSKAAIVHDYLYDNALRTKKEADLIFYEAMEVLGVPKWKRLIMYWAVRVFGRGSY